MPLAWRRTLRPMNSAGSDSRGELYAPQQAMISHFALFLISLAYLSVLFGIAYVGDRIPERLIRRFKPVIIALGATIYCSAWSFYGITAQAANNGWWFPPTFLGSIALFVLCVPLLKKLIRVSKEANVTSIADYCAVSFGRSRALAVIVSLVSLVLLIPYIALQLKAITVSFHILSDNLLHANYLLDTPPLLDTAFYMSLILALFAIAFGTRHLDSREHHNGLMLAIAFEAIVKITAICVLAWFVTFVLFDGLGEILVQTAQSETIAQLRAARPADQGFLTAVALGFVATICLPRMFHVLVVESESPRDLKTVRWLFPTYLILFGLCILPIAYAGLLQFQHQDVSAEQFVMRLPLAADHTALALIAYLGGLSAGSSMVIVACVAMATMICNELIVPVLLRNRWVNLHNRDDISHLLRLVRRLTIVAVMLLAYLYYRLFANNDALSAIGLLSFALVAQLAPALFLSLLGRGGRAQARAAVAGIAAGFGVWLYTLLLPMLSRAGGLDPQWLHQGLFGLTWLRPTALFGIEGLSEISHGTLWSLFFNGLCFFGLTRWSQVDSATAAGSGPINPPVYRLQELAARFLGAEQAQLALKHYPTALLPHRRAEPDYIDYVEGLLAGVIGSVSARHVIERVLATGNDNEPLLKETSQIFLFSRELLQASIDNISQGVSVVDAKLNLVAWNRRYMEMFRYPQDLVHVGRPIADVLRYNARRECDADEVEAFVEKRLRFMAAGSAYLVTRERDDGQVLEIRGNPMPGGGFVTTFTDISDYQKTMDALRDTRANLEQRVAERTQALEQANAQLREANTSKTRFLAAAGHDLVQPLNAAKLFAAALLQRNIEHDTRELLQNLDNSLHSADAIISELLALAKLDAGAVRPHSELFVVGDLLQSLAQDFSVLAQEKGLQLRWQRSSMLLNSDFKLLRRILQNLLANAVRYTPIGRVLLGCRRRGNQVLIEVWDTGCGIPASEQSSIFVEFRRLDANAKDGGLGLGLATVQRLCQLLCITLEVKSVVGRGSVFRLVLPHAQASMAAGNDCSSSHPISLSAAFAPIAAQESVPKALQGLKVLCIDNEPTIISATEALLASWGCEFYGLNELQETQLEQLPWRPDVVLVDYHLDDGATGTDVLDRVQRHFAHTIAAVVISADYTNDVRALAKAAGYHYLKKPLKVASLRALLTQLAKQAASQP